MEKKFWQELDYIKLVYMLCKKFEVGIDEHSVEVAHRLGNRSKDAPVLATFRYYNDKIIVLKAKQKFRNEGVLVVEDFPPEIVQRRNMFSPTLTAAYKSPGNRAFLSGDKLVLNGKTYTHKDLDKLPVELRPRTLATVTKGNITAFYSRNSELSNHFSCNFTTGEGLFTSVEQYLMYQKANHFSDEDTATAIRQTNDPVHAKNLGKHVKNFNLHEWEEVCDQYMQVGISAKFEQNPHLAKFLKETGSSTLAEANHLDNYWGIGLPLSDTGVWDKSKWNGSNKLGRKLADLRDSL